MPCGDDHRSDAEIFKLCPHTASAIHEHLSHSAPAAGAEAVPEEHHRCPAAPGIGVAQLVHKHHSVRLSGARRARAEAPQRAQSEAREHYQDPPGEPAKPSQFAAAVGHTLAADQPPPVPLHAPPSPHRQREACIHSCAMDSAGRTCGKSDKENSRHVSETFESVSSIARASRPSDEEFTGLFVFEFDEEGRVAHHTIEHTEEGHNWDKTIRFISVTDWLLGRAWGRREETPSLAFVRCEREKSIRHRRGR
ncbi:hypothetical protein OPT61_g2712 [Boeremia exigua]|uniref:Uncharacterized protein n=1 Tax=Boeremia exigua TaxID=749465 RepID=A0ACC2IKG8_9PLEO|nr:hypothetical protein OPT61_g2712 [Boeremia exigua]